MNIQLKHKKSSPCSEWKVPDTDYKPIQQMIRIRIAAQCYLLAFVYMHCMYFELNIKPE